MQILTNEGMLLNLNEGLQKIKHYNDKSNSNNIFSILGMDDYEIRHSNMLKWLFDKNITTTTGFHEANLYDYLLNFISKDDLKGLRNCEFSIYREKQNLDMQITFKKDNKYKWVFVIENKINAGEGFDQLKNYRLKIESNTYFSSSNKSFIYLTPSGVKPKDEVEKQKWQTSSYKDIYNIIQKNYKKYEDNLTNEEKLLTNNYLDLLKKRGIVMDKDFNILLNAIYTQNTEAINCMYDLALSNRIRMDLIKAFLVGKGFRISQSKDINFLNIYDENLQSLLVNKGYRKDSFTWSLRIDNSNIISLYYDNYFPEIASIVSNNIKEKLDKAKEIKVRKDGFINIYGHKFYTEEKWQKETDKRINLITGLDNFFNNEYKTIIEIIEKL